MTSALAYAWPLLQLMLPLFVLTTAGFALARGGWLRDGWQGALSELTARLFIPAFLFSGAWRNGIPASISWQFMAAFFVPLLLLFLLVAWSMRSTRDGAARALAATYSNTVFVGVPVITQAFGADSLQYAFPVIAFHALVAFTLYYLHVPAAGGKRLGASLLATLRNPIVVSLMLGLAFNASGWHAPQPVERVLALLSGAALPCALLALGASLAAFQVRGWTPSLIIVLIKLVALPAGVLGMAHLLGVPPAAGAVLMILAACPAGVNGAAVVQAGGADAGVVSSAILLSSVLCMLTLPAWLALAGAG